MKKQTYVFEKKPKGVNSTPEMVKLLVTEQEDASGGDITGSGVIGDLAVFDAEKNIVSSGKKVADIITLPAFGNNKVIRTNGSGNLIADNKLSFATNGLLIENATGYRLSFLDSNTYMQFFQAGQSITVIELKAKQIQLKADTTVTGKLANNIYIEPTGAGSNLYYIQKQYIDDLISQTVETDKASITKWYSAKSIYDWVKLQMLNIIQIKETRANNTRQFWDGTQAQLDLVITRDPNTYYYELEP